MPVNNRLHPDGVDAARAYSPGPGDLADPEMWKTARPLRFEKDGYFIKFLDG